VVKVGTHNTSCQSHANDASETNMSSEPYVADRYGLVADVFDRVISEASPGGGAGLAVGVEGQVVIDLWGGSAGHDRRRSADTLDFLWSGTKGLVALCMLMLVGSGELALARPVSYYWPEFGSCGKTEITVDEVLSHRARLPGLRSNVDQLDVLDARRMAALLAAQPPQADPRAVAAYHPLTYGWICDELMQRVTGETTGGFLASKVARPLTLDIWLGLPPEHEHRVATLLYGPDWALNWPETRSGSDPLFEQVYVNPPMFPKEIPWNHADHHAAEVPGVGGIADARSMARLYGALATGGTSGATRIIDEQTLASGRNERSRFHDALTSTERRFGAGFELQTAERRLGPPPDAYGHTGAGGTVSAAWPSLRTGVSFLSNEMLLESNEPSRAARLLDAVHRCLVEHEQHGALGGSL
jgi:CubicO group peptidase (beta-lactamase class C family)